MNNGVNANSSKVIDKITKQPFALSHCRGRGFAFVSFADAATVGIVLQEPLHQMDNYAIVEVKPYRARVSNAASASMFLYSCVNLYVASEIKLL